ncbi:MAG: FkbM family methyltransferase [Solirubrobacterales bacterium]|nr:MAG: FkbM family methyltransferase [Solirubrobacterales bacterium]
MAVTGLRAQDRIDRLARLVHHPDPSQLFFQIAEIAGEQTYLRHGIEVGPGDLVLDVGANVGVAAVFFAELCRASVVHSFEPVEPVCRLLRENVSGIGACVVHEQGLSDAARRTEITYYPGACAMSGLYADPARDRELVRTVLLNHGLSPEQARESLAGRYAPSMRNCELRTLSSFLAEHSIDRVALLKIDVERAEVDVLTGIDDADWSKLQQVVVEVHDEDGRAGALSAQLRARGFDVAGEQEAAMRGTAVRMLYARRP